MGKFKTIIFVLVFSYDLLSLWENLKHFEQPFERLLIITFDLMFILD